RSRPRRPGRVRRPAGEPHRVQATRLSGRSARAKSGRAGRSLSRACVGGHLIARPGRAGGRSPCGALGIARQRPGRTGGALVIPARELFDLRAEWSLDVGVIEKDYVLGWLLAGIANHPDLAATWVFKGGTCLRKCFYETYRFSEDLDFTVVEGGPETPEELQPIFATIGEWVREESG